MLWPLDGDNLLFDKYFWKPIWPGRDLSIALAEVALEMERP